MESISPKIYCILFSSAEGSSYITYSDLFNDTEIFGVFFIWEVLSILTILGKLRVPNPTVFWMMQATFPLNSAGVEDRLKDLDTSNDHLSICYWWKYLPTPPQWLDLFGFVYCKL